MVGNIRTWKKQAKCALKGNYGLAVTALILTNLTVILGSSLSVVLFPGESPADYILSFIFQFIVSLITSIFSAGMSYLYLKISRGEQAGLSDLLYFFKNNPDRVIVAGFVLAMLNLLANIPYYYVSWTTPVGNTPEGQLFYIQQITIFSLITMGLYVLLALPFTQMYYLLAAHPEMSGVESVKESMRLMKGKKFKFLKMQLSFLPMIVIYMIFTLGIGLFWLMPHMEMTAVYFYRELVEGHKVVEDLKTDAGEEGLSGHTAEQNNDMI